MPNLVLALAIIFGGWWLFRKLGSSKPAAVRKLMRKGAGIAIMVAGGFLMLRDQIGLALPLMALGAGMFGESALFPNGFNWPPGAAQSGPRAEPPPSRPPRTVMARGEALAVLGLKPGASAGGIP